MIRVAKAAALSLVILGLSSAAQAVPITIVADMTGANEVPPTGSPAIGSSVLTLDIAAHTLLVDIAWSGLTGGNPAAAHIHCCTVVGTSVGVAVGFPGFPTTTSGTYLHLFDLTDLNIYTAGFRTNFGGGTAAGSEAALEAGLIAGQAYTNIHNAVFGGGEIRGLLVVPEPGTLTVFGFGLAGLGLLRRRKSKAAK